MIVESTSSTWFEARCAQDVDAMLRRLEELGPDFKMEKKHGDDETYDTETSTVVNESSFENNDEHSVGAPVSDVSSEQEDRDHRDATKRGGATEEQDDDDSSDNSMCGEGGKPVQFVNMGVKRDDLLPPKDELQKLSNDELLVLLEQMRERLAKSLIDVTGERFIRRKKEKTLEKLAKELCKRVKEGEMKDNQIRDLNCSLKKTSETLAEIKKAEEKARAECETAKKEHEVFKLAQKAKMDAQVAKYMAQLQTLRESYNTELYSGQKLKDALEEMEVQYDSTIRKYRKGTFVSICLATLAGGVATGHVKPYEIRDRFVAHATVLMENAVETGRDNFCGPVPNGFTMPGNSFTFDAPWWAPEGKKQEWFALCGDRTRSRMHWDWINNKLSAFALDKDERVRRLWTFRIPDARVVGDKVLIAGRDGKMQRELSAPWAS
ncbi:hypothetical protein MPSEU_000474200 [Mayamaea pseudoterrestris]|nr:hypothetical protein MPSEU_000474200 [Mayamaea pseudoterrestris]